jgi:uncharacterized protein
VSLRTITYQMELGLSNHEVNYNLDSFSRMVNEFSDAYCRPRTHRVVTGTIRSRGDFKYAKYIAVTAKEKSLWGACIPVDMYSSLENISYAHELIKDNFSFFNMIISREEALGVEAVKEVSRFIVESAEQDPIYNFRVGVSSVEKNATPFFPFATVKRGNEFTIGLELINILTEIVDESPRKPLSELKTIMISKIGEIVRDIENIADSLADKHGLSYGGVDLSIAPYPYPLDDQSVAALVEKIGNMGRSRGEPVFEFGFNGTYFINGFLTKVIKEVADQNRSTGFNGVMYSLLEDTHLANRYDDGNFDINFLKHLATSCGCGVDMVPMECSDNTSTAVASIIMDVYTASYLMNKPLGIRVLPIPGARIGDRTNFKHLFFTNTKVRDVGSGITVQNLPKQDVAYKAR